MMSGYGGGPGGGDWSCPPPEDVDWTAAPSSSAAISAPMKQSQPPAPPSTRQQLSAPFIPDNSQCFKAIYKRGGNRGKYYVAPQTQDNVDPFLVPPECDADEETLAEKLNQKVIESKPTGFDWGQAEPIREEDVPKPTIGSDWDDWGAPSLEKKIPPAAADPPVPTTAQPVPSSSGYCGGGSKDAAPVRQPQRPQKQQSTQDIPSGWQTVLSPTPSRNDWATPANAATPPRMINTAPANSSPSDGFRRRWNNNEGDSNRGGGSYNDQPQQTPFQDRATNATPGQGGGRWNNTERDSNRSGYNARPQQQQPPASPAQPKPISNGASYNDWGAPPQATRGDSAPVEPSQPAPSNDNWGAAPSVEMKAAPQDWSVPPPPAPVAPVQTSQQQYNAPSGWNNNERDLNRGGGSYNDQPQQRPFQDRASTAAPGQGGGRWNNERDSNRGGGYNARPQQQQQQASSYSDQANSAAPPTPAQPISASIGAAIDWCAPPSSAISAPTEQSTALGSDNFKWSGSSAIAPAPSQSDGQQSAPAPQAPADGYRNDGGRWNNERDSNRGGYNARPQQQLPSASAQPKPTSYDDWGAPPQATRRDSAPVEPSQPAPRDDNWGAAPSVEMKAAPQDWSAPPPPAPVAPVQTSQQQQYNAPRGWNNNERDSNRGGGYNTRPQQPQTQSYSSDGIDWGAPPATVEVSKAPAPVKPSQPATAPSGDDWGAAPSVEMKAAPQDWSVPPPPAPVAPVQTSQQQYNAPSGWNNNERDLNRRGGSYNDQPQQRPFQDRATTAAPGQGGGRWNNERDSNRGGSYNARPQQQPKSYSSDGIDWGAPPATVEDSKAPAPVEPSQPAPSNDNWGAPPSVEMKAAPQDWSAPPPPAPAAPVQTSQQQYNAPRGWNNNERDSNRGGGSYNDQPQQRPFQDRATNATPGQGGGRWNNNERDSNRGGGYNARPQQFHDRAPQPQRAPEPAGTGEWIEWGTPPEQLQQSNWQQAPRGGGGYRNDGDRWNNNNERYSNRGRGGGGYNARPQQQQTQMVSIQEDPNVDWSRV